MRLFLARPGTAKRIQKLSATETRYLSQLPRAWGILFGTLALGILLTSIWPTLSRGQDVNAEKTDDIGATIESGLPDLRKEDMKAPVIPVVEATDKLNWIGLDVEDFPLISAAFKEPQLFPSRSALNKYADRLRSEIKNAKEMPSSVSRNRLGQMEAELELTSFYIRQTEFATQLAKMALKIAEIELSAAREANRRVADTYSEQAISQLQRHAEVWRLRYQQLLGEVPPQASSPH